MNIACREEELQILKRIYSSKKPEMLAICGRRRIGKTHLIRSFFEEKQGIFFNATGTKDDSYRTQISNFTQRIGETFLGGIMPKEGRNWKDTFQLLTDAINKVPKDKKIILFLDELPWMATKKSKLLQTLDYYWNQYWSRDKRIKLIVCGSSASWIIDKIINNKGGLHNRITETIYLQPLTLSETERYLALNKVRLTRKQITEIYMVTGGVPYYLDKIEAGLSAVQIIESLAFRPKAFLLNEFDNLFSSLFEDSDACIEMIKAIANHRYGIGQDELFKLLTRTSKGNTGLSRLKALEDAGFIISFTPHFHKKRGIYYRVSDEYTLFYLQWIAPLKESKMSKALEKGYWEILSQTPKWFAWAGYAFEAVCYKHLNQIRRALDLSPTAFPNSWRYVPQKSKDKEIQGAQIDLLFDRQDNSITICEIKYTKKTFHADKQYIASLENKRKVFRQQTRTKKHIFIAMIASDGVKESINTEKIITKFVKLDDLFQE